MRFRKCLLLTPIFLLIFHDFVFAQNIIPENVKAVIQSRVDRGDNMSIVVGTVDSSGTDFYVYGKMAASDLTVPNKFTIFEIGSITKVFTTILLVDMVERVKFL